MSPRRVELRQKGKHFTVTDERGRVLANDTNPADGEASFRRLLVGHSREAARVDPKAKYSRKERDEMELLTRKAPVPSHARFRRNYDEIDWSR